MLSGETINASEDFFDRERESIGFAEPLNTGVAVTSPEQGRQLTIAIESLVVHFCDNDVLVAGKQFDQSIGQRVDVAQVNARDAASGFHAALDRRPDRTVG